MMTRAALALLVSFTVLASPVAASADARPGIFVVGDSHVQLLGPMLTRQLEEDGYRVLGHHSRPGWSTARYRRAGDLREVLEAAGRPEVVVVSLGGNDFVRNADHYREDLAWVVQQARLAGAREVVWLGPATSDVTVSERAASTGARHERNADLQRQLLPSMGVQWFDSRPATHDDHGRDGIHFTRAGYRHWSGQALSTVETIAATQPLTVASAAA